MAAGYLRHLGQGRIEIFSAGSIPATSINPVAGQAMAEEGIGIANEHPVEAAVRTVALGLEPLTVLFVDVMAG